MDKQRREDWIRAVYETRDAIGYSHAADVAPRLDMDLDGDMNDRNEWRQIGRYWKQRGFIRGESTKTGLAYEMVQITADGIRYVEEGEASVSLGTTINIAGNVYASPIATSGGHVEMHNVFTFGDLDRLIEERGGDDRDALHEIARELRQQLAEHDTLSKGWLRDWLIRHSLLLNQHAWIVQPLAVLLLNWGMGQPLSSG